MQRQDENNNDDAIFKKPHTPDRKRKQPENNKAIYVTDLSEINLRKTICTSDSPNTKAIKKLLDASEELNSPVAENPRSKTLIRVTRLHKNTPRPKAKYYAKVGNGPFSEALFARKKREEEQKRFDEFTNGCDPELARLLFKK